MEKPMIKEALPSVESPGVDEDASGVFRVLEAFSDLPKTYEPSQEALNRLVASFDLEPEEYAPILEQTSAKLKELDTKEACIVSETQTNLLATIRAWAHKHRMAATLLIAGALHAPIIFKTTGLAESVQNILQTAKKWEMPNMVIKPQTEAEKQDVVNRIHERGSRVDHQKIQAYKKSQLEKLESGEAIKLNDTFLKLEELNGEDPEKVKLAEQKKQAMIEKFSQKMGEDFTDEFIRSVVTDMFGADTNYEWGQGSATEYFITGKRNCVSIARAEQMVFEALIDRLPMENRAKYQLGTAFEKQHEIAVLKILKQDGTISRTYFLQPPVDTLFGTADRPGSPTVNLATMQRAMVSEKPAKISSNAKLGDIPPSPDIEVLTNQPASLNIEIQGDLRGSDYIEQIVEEREIEIQWKEPSTTDEIPDLEIIKNNDVEKAKQKIEDAYKFIEANKPECKNVNDCLSEEEIDRAIPYTSIDLSFVDWNNLEPDQVQEIFSRLLMVRVAPDPDTINLGDINKLHITAIAYIPKLKFSEITVELKNDESGNLSMKNIYDLINMYKLYEKGGINIAEAFPRIHILLDEGMSHHSLNDLLRSLPAGQFIFDLKNTSTRSFASTDTVEAIVGSKAKVLYLEGVDLTDEGLEMIINNPNKTYHFGLTLYLENLVRRPEIINLPHIKPWIDRIVVGSQIEETINSLPPEKRASIVPKLEQLERESIDKFFFAHN